jgi:hypothetical protein
MYTVFGCEDEKGMDLFQDRAQWRGLASAVLNLQFPLSVVTVISYFERNFFALSHEKRFILHST